MHVVRRPTLGLALALVMAIAGACGQPTPVTAGADPWTDVAPCNQQPDPGHGLLTCLQGLDRGAPGMPAGVDSRLDRYTMHQGEQPREVWNLIQHDVGPFPHGGPSLLTPKPPTCYTSDWITTIDARTGENLVEGPDSIVDVPCPTG